MSIVFLFTFYFNISLCCIVTGLLACLLYSHFTFCSRQVPKRVSFHVAPYLLDWTLHTQTTVKKTWHIFKFNMVCHNLRSCFISRFKETAYIIWSNHLSTYCWTLLKRCMAQINLSVHLEIFNQLIRLHHDHPRKFGIQFQFNLSSCLHSWRNYTLQLPTPYCVSLIWYINSVVVFSNVCQKLGLVIWL